MCVCHICRFHVACSVGLFEIVNLLISHGAEVNVLSIHGKSVFEIPEGYEYSAIVA